MSLHADELRVLANQAEDRNWLESDVDTLRMAAAGIESLEAQLERLTVENAALRANVGEQSVLLTRAKETSFGLSLDNARLKSEPNDDLDEYEDYMDRLDRLLCESIDKIGEMPDPPVGFPDSIDVACRLLESIPALRAEVERLAPREMTPTLGSLVRWTLRNDWPLMNVAYLFDIRGHTFVKCIWFDEDTGACDSAFPIEQLVIAQGLERDAKGGE